MSLEKELEGVKATDIESPDDVTSDPTEEGVVVAGNEDDEPSDDGGASGAAEPANRTIENVRRELLRKHTESERRIMMQVSQIGELVKSAFNAAPAGKKSVQTWDDVSVEEMDTMRSQVPAEQKEAFEQLYTKKLVAKNVHDQFSQYSEAEKYARERERANQTAVTQYPQLTDKFSTLHAEVNRRLAGMDENYRKYNPRIVLHITQDVAAEMGIAPRRANQSRAVPRPGSVDGKKPSATPATETVFASDESFDKLASKLSGGRIKFDEAALKRIKERGKAYRQAMPKE